MGKPQKNGKTPIFSPVFSPGNQRIQGIKKCSVQKTKGGVFEL